VNSGLQEIVLLTVAQIFDWAISAIRDDERHVENVSLPRILYDLDVGCIELDFGWDSVRRRR
jgi:hypothetical protein